MHMQSALRALRVEIDSLLKPMGFKRELRSIWVRRQGWKEEVIELKRVHPGVLLNFYVEVPSRPQQQNRNDVVAVRGLGHIVGERFPVLPFAPSQASVSRVIEHLTRGLRWFDSFSSPEACLEAMRQHGKNPESISYREIAAYLAALSDTPRPPSDEGRTEG